MVIILFPRWQILWQGPRGDYAREWGEAKPTVGDRAAVGCFKNLVFLFINLCPAVHTHCFSLQLHRSSLIFWGKVLCCIVSKCWIFSSLWGSLPYARTTKQNPVSALTAEQRAELEKNNQCILEDLLCSSWNKKPSFISSWFRVQFFELFLK